MITNDDLGFPLTALTGDFMILTLTPSLDNINRELLKK